MQNPVEHMPVFGPEPASHGVPSGRDGYEQLPLMQLPGIV
jgi:hypothetical protein